MFAESWVMFYLIGSGKTIKETIINYKLDKITKNFEILLSDTSLFLTKIADNNNGL